jgi:hypothetical protein
MPFFLSFSNSKSLAVVVEKQNENEGKNAKKVAQPDEFKSADILEYKHQQAPSIVQSIVESIRVCCVNVNHEKD